MKLDKELVAASSAPLILSILAEGDSYGYAIIQRVHELSAGQMQWTDGMLYPVLHWLEENGQIRGRWEKSETGRRRRYYSIQPKGKKFLKEQREQWSVVTSTLEKIWSPKYA
jgi:PadR family transcriptional regulator PadR